MGVTQLEWREVHHDSFWMGLNGEAGREERQRRWEIASPPQIFIAVKSPGLTQGLAASRVGLRAPRRACGGTLGAASAGQAGE